MREFFRRLPSLRSPAMTPEDVLDSLERVGLVGAVTELRELLPK
jgi:hypothetical protein